MIICNHFAGAYLQVAYVPRSDDYLDEWRTSRLLLICAFVDYTAITQQAFV